MKRQRENAVRIIQRRPVKKIKIKANPAAELYDDFSKIPNGVLCQSIQLLLNELKSRGFPLYDFDDKKRSLQQIQIIGAKIYFLAASEEDSEEGSKEETADRI